jgi:hypothetical protein
MKKFQLTIIALVFLPLFSFSQDYWELFHTNDTSYIYCIQIANDGTIYYGGIGGLFISHDDGQTWDYKYLHKYRDILNIAFDMDSNLICGSDDGVYKYKIIEDEWELLFEPDNGGFSSILVVEDTIYAVGGSGSYRYANGNWDNLGRGGADIVEDNEGRLFIGSTGFTGGGRVWQSLDKGDTWASIGLYDSYIVDLATDSQGRLYVGSIGNHEYGIGGLYRYNREEGIWDTLRLYYSVNCICFNEEDSLYIGQYTTGGPPAGAVFSPDYGETWNYISSGFQGPGFPNVRELALGPDNHLYAVMEDVSEIYKSTGTTIVGIIEPTVYPGFNVDVFPNPFSTKLSITMTNQDNGRCTIFVCNLAGKVVLQENNVLLNNGKASLAIPECPPGMYLLRITIDNKTTVKKIIKY